MVKIDPEVELPPMENLIVEVLVARYRLGEKTWNFDLSVGKQVSSLVHKGYVRQFQKRPRNLLVVGLTDEAIAMNLSYDYVPTIAKGNPELTEAFRGITRQAQELKLKLENKRQSKRKAEQDAKPVFSDNATQPENEGEGRDNSEAEKVIQDANSAPVDSNEATHRGDMSEERDTGSETIQTAVPVSNPDN